MSAGSDDSRRSQRLSPTRRVGTATRRQLPHQPTTKQQSPRAARTAGGMAHGKEPSACKRKLATHTQRRRAVAIRTASSESPATGCRTAAEALDAAAQIEEAGDEQADIHRRAGNEVAAERAFDRSRNTANKIRAAVCEAADRELKGTRKPATSRPLRKEKPQRAACARDVLSRRARRRSHPAARLVVFLAGLWRRSPLFGALATGTLLLFGLFVLREAERFAPEIVGLAALAFVAGVVRGWREAGRTGVRHAR